MTEQVVWCDAMQTVPFLMPDSLTISTTSRDTSWKAGIQPRDCSLEFFLINLEFHCVDLQI